MFVEQQWATSRQVKVSDFASDFDDAFFGDGSIDDYNGIPMDSSYLRPMMSGKASRNI